MSTLLTGYLSEADRQNLARADQRWTALRHQTLPAQDPVIHTHSDPLRSIDYDIIISGGTLGILIGAALAQRGWRIGLIERGSLRGRDQEWNISEKELRVFLELELLTEAELEQIIVTQYNPARIGFHQGSEFWVRDVLNIGVNPVLLLATLKQRFLQAGGILWEQTAFGGATVHPNGISVQTGQGSVSARLLLDAMGHFSPIVRQIRQDQSPDGVCLVVGSCAQGIPASDRGDLIYTFTPIQNHCQYFWEAFPARDGRTTYLFTYVDTDPARPSLTTLFEDYLRLLPTYQDVDLNQIHFQRILAGFFPAYRHSPLQSPWSRILAVGDSSGSQSPLSFGGFGSMVRHLRRLDQGIHEALQTDTLTRDALAILQPYQPNLAVTWLFQKTMSVRIHDNPDPNQINQLLSKVFTAIFNCGDAVVKPFLQDVVQFSGLSQTLLRVMLAEPTLVAQLVGQLGPGPLLNWLKHYLTLGAYGALDPWGPSLDVLLKPFPPPSQYFGHQWQQALTYGSGGDYDETLKKP